MEQQPQQPEAAKANDLFPCPFGKPYNRVIICSAPIEETGVPPEWYMHDHSAHVVTRQFCANRCAKADVAKPVIHRS